MNALLLKHLQRKVIKFSPKPIILGTNQGGIDFVTIRNGVVHLVDNKALTRSGNVASVSSLTTNFPKNLATIKRGTYGYANRFCAIR